MVDFSNKVVWITGASSGIGEALTYAFAKSNAKVIISARREDELQRVKNNVNNENIFVLPLDVTKPETFDLKVAEAGKAFGSIDILLHNSGISHRSWVNDTEMEVHRRVMEVNYFGCIGLTKAILPYFIEKNKGHFAVISSVSGKLSIPMRSAYCASKHAIQGYFDGLRAEVWRNNIKVTVVCPGFVRTNISFNALKANGEINNVMDNTIGNGYPVEKVAEQILKVIHAGKFEAYVGKKMGKEQISLFVNRFFPNLFKLIVRKHIPK